MQRHRRLCVLAKHLVAAVEEVEVEDLYFFPNQPRSILPALTNDMAQAKRDIDVFGYCLWANALSEEEISTMARRLVAQADAEVRDGLAKDGATHFIGSIVNKGEEFEPLLTHPEAEELLTHLLGEHYNLSTGFAKIVKPGAVAETLHTDQWWLPPPQIRERGPGAMESQPEVRTGSITRELAYTTAMHSGDHVATIADRDGGSPRTVSFIPPCAANQALFCVSDFTETNGSTLLVPGSHLAGRHPTKEEAKEGGKAAGAVALCAPAGTCIVFDSRCWHMSGSYEGVEERKDSNEEHREKDHSSAVTVGQSLKELLPLDDSWVEPHTGKPWRLGVFMNYVGPMIRQNENFALSMDPDVLARLSDAAKARLGLKTWFGYGHVGGGGESDKSKKPGTGRAKTHDGNFKERLKDTDDWIGRHQPGPRRLE
eukprot:COSAG02_NODE_298_length_25350_cov_48.266999_29_plen_427_part_00